MRLKHILFWLCWPALFLYFYRSQRSRVLITAENKTLLVKGWWSRAFGDTHWSLPGGGLRWKEAPLKGAVRELAEELGLHVANKDLQYLGQAYIRQHGIGYRGHFFLLALSAMPELKIQTIEINEPNWFASVKLAERSDLEPEVVAALELLGKQ